MLMQVMESHMHRKRGCVDIDTDDVSATSRKERKEMLLEVGENVLDLPRKEEHHPLTHQQLIELFTPPYDSVPLVEPPAQVNESKCRLIEPVRKESLCSVREQHCCKYCCIKCFDTEQQLTCHVLYCSLKSAWSDDYPSKPLRKERVRW
jgi:hypothetical protein